MFECWKVKTRHRVGQRDLWQRYLRMLDSLSASSSDGENPTHNSGLPNGILKMDISSEAQQQFRRLVDAFSKQCLTGQQKNSLSRLVEDEEARDPGICLMLPHEVYLTKAHSSVCPLALLAQYLRWPDLNSTKDLRRLEFMCKDADCSLPGGSSGYLPVTQEHSQPCEPSKMDSLECCNPFHWARLVHESVMPHQRTEKQLLSVLHPFDYDTADTDSVKDESAQNDRCSSTETGISRKCGGQISAGTTSVFDDDHRNKTTHYSLIPLRSTSHHWCLIRYWEGTKSLGSLFKVVEPILNISYSALRQSDMSLEAIENAERKTKTKELRGKIGRGLTLILDSTQRRVSIYCRSELSLYVSSRYLEHTHRDETERGNAAAITGDYDDGQVTEYRSVKVPSGYLICAYDLDWRGPQRDGAVPLAGSGNSICVSFGKGFGPTYHRLSVRDCLCWVEISLDGLIDRRHHYR